MILESRLDSFDDSSRELFGMYQLTISGFHDLMSSSRLHCSQIPLLRTMFEVLVADPRLFAFHLIKIFNLVKKLIGFNPKKL